MSKRIRHPCRPGMRYCPIAEWCHRGEVARNLGLVLVGCNIEQDPDTKRGCCVRSSWVPGLLPGCPHDTGVHTTTLLAAGRQRSSVRPAVAATQRLRLPAVQFHQLQRRHGLGFHLDVSVRSHLSNYYFIPGPLASFIVLNALQCFHIEGF